jgi:ABC-type Mn2+/Zn2+ transport system permease subunit
MNSKFHAIAELDFARWFVILSPLIGVLLGLLGVFLVNH